VAPPQNALWQSEAPGSQILGSLVWASHRNAFSSFRTTNLRADLHALSVPSPHIDDFPLNKEARVYWKERGGLVTALTGVKLISV